MDRSFGDGLGAFILMVAGLLVVCVPLAIWKAVEIIIWIINHISVSVK